MNILTSNTQQSMTSLHIANLVGTRHSLVKQSIERLAVKGVIVQSPLVTEQSLDALGRPRAMQVYVFSGEQGKRDSIVVVAQLSPEFTAQLVDRWQELESQAQPIEPAIALPQDYLSALKALVSSEEEKQVIGEQLAIAAPKAAALDTLSHASGSLGIRETANTVGIPERQFIARCTDKNKPESSRFMYRDDKDKLRAYAHRIKQGFMTQKITSYMGSNGRSRVTVQVKFTAAGVAHIAKQMQVKPVKAVKQLGVA